MTDEVINIMRHRSVFDPTEFPYPMHVIGAGATGSRVFAALVELGVTNITVWDDDEIADHNLANQIYHHRHIGAKKVWGCKDFACDKLGQDNLPSTMIFMDSKVTPVTIRENMLAGGVVFILTDTMESREQIFRSLCNRADRAQGSTTSSMTTTPLCIIETRMGSTHGTVFTINPFDHKQRDEWLSTLVDDSDEDAIELSPCGTPLSVGTTASLIANYAVWQMMQFFVDPVGLQPRVDLFFKPTLTITSSAIAA